MRKLLFIVVFAAIVVANCFAQSPGDIAIVQLRTDTEDGFSFVALVDITGNATITFTDNAWNDTILLSNEDTITWTAPAGGISAGTVVTWQNNSGVDTGTVVGALSGLSATGDQIIAFSGYSTAPTFLFAVSTTTWLTTGAVNTNTSYLPLGLTVGVNALSFNPSIDNAFYNIASNSGSVAILLNSICNVANWTTNNDGTLIFQPSSYWAFSTGASMDPVKLEFTSVNSGNAVYLNLPFDVEVVLRDSTGGLTVATGDINITLSKLTGSGNLTGTLTGTIPLGSSSKVFSGLSYDVAETGVSLLIEDDIATLESDTSNVFEVLAINAPPALVITEIMYNPPESGTDSLEFIEIYNNDIATVDLAGYYFSAGVTFTFPVHLLNPGEYVVVASNAVAVQSFYGITAFDCTGSLSNIGEAIVLNDPFGQIVDTVFYDDIGLWPTSANGGGPSLTLCNPSLDNNDPLNWSVSIYYVDTVAGIQVFATPATGCYVPVASRLVFQSVNNGVNPVINTPFDVYVISQDNMGNDAIVTSDVNITIGLVSGTGNITGTLTGTIPNGSSSVTITGLNYDVSEDSVRLNVTDDGAVLTADTSQFFNVLSTVPVPVKLAVVSVNSGINPIVGSPFDVVVEIQDSSDGAVQATENVSVSLSLASGTGNLGGVLNGIITVGNTSTTITGITYDIAETGVSITASDDSLLLADGTSVLFDVEAAPAPPALVITEIMYNSPESGTDSLEFFEIFNNDIVTVDLNGYYFSAGVTFTFPAYSLNPGEYVVVASNAPAVQSFYGITAFDCTGSLSNSGEAIVLNDSYGQIVDTVFFDDTGLWPTAANGGGQSLTLCNPSLNNNDPLNWSLSIYYIDTVAAIQVFATPGAGCYVPVATRLVFQSVNGGVNPAINTPFNVLIAVQDDMGNVATVSSGVNITIGLVNGNGNLTGTITGTIANGTSSVTITGLNYDVVEDSVRLNVTDDAVLLTTDTSQFFNVLSTPPVPVKLAIVSVNSGINPVVGIPFNLVVEIQDSSDGAIQATENVSVSLSLASGTGNLGGVLSGIITVGNTSTTISGITYDLVETGVSITASDDSLLLADGTSVLFDVEAAPAPPALVITEIMYNSPESGTDSLEFLEVYNNDTVTVDLNGYYFSAGVTFTFPVHLLNPGEYVVVAANALAVQSFYGITAFDCTGSLSNSGEALALNDAYGQLVDSVFFDDTGLWPGEANGGGQSLTLCNPSLDNNDPLNWSLSINYIDTVAGKQVFATPGSGCVTPEPFQLAIISVNNGVNPLVNAPFDVKIEVWDATGFPATVTSNVNITLSLITGSGTLGGMLTGTIPNGSSTFTISGTTYGTEETGVSIKVVDNSLVLAADTSNLFDVVGSLPVPVKLVVVSVNSGANPSVNAAFNIVVETRDASDNLANVLVNTNISLSLATGLGNLGGTLTGVLNAGNNTVTIQNTTYDTEDVNVSITASDVTGLLANGTSELFNVIATYPVVGIGGIAFIQFRTVTEDGFAFVALKNIPGSAEIKITDNGYNENSALTSTENMLKWTAPATGLSANSVVVWQNGVGVNVGTVNGTLNGLSELGDQLIAYQGPDASPSFIYALSTVPWTTTGSINENKSYLPAGLTNANTAIYFSNEKNGYYNLTPVFGTYAHVLSSVSDTVNWTVSTSTGSPFQAAGFWDFGVGISENTTLQSSLLIYPNPVKNNLVAENLQKADKIFVSNMMGQGLIEVTVHNEKESINTTELRPGIYLITVIYNDGKIQTARFVKY